MDSENASHRLIGDVQMFRIRVAMAECKLKQLREQALEAKRRRKEAKRIAQRARKQFQRSKSDLAELRQALAKAEEKLFEAGGRALATMMGKQKRAAKIGAQSGKKPNVSASKASRTSSGKPKRLTLRKRAGGRAKALLKGRSTPVAVGPKPFLPQTLNLNTPTYEYDSTDQGKQEAQG